MNTLVENHYVQTVNVNAPRVVYGG